MKSFCTKICTVIFSSILAATFASSALASPITIRGGSVATLDTPGSPLPPLPPPTTGGGSVA